MQRDIHFYGVYALARAAGIDSDTSRTIAHASQFVDDAIDEDVVTLPDQKAILPIMTSHKPLDYKNTLPGYQWTVWVHFHFLPGNEPAFGAFMDRMICRKDSEPAQRMLTHALNPNPASTRDYWPHLIGITAHVYADTFSHYGFMGMAHPWNRVKTDSIEASGDHSPSILHYIENKLRDFKERFTSPFAEIMPVGHGAVATYPDRPYLKWKFEYEDEGHNPPNVIRDNGADYLEACEGLHAFFYEFSQRDPDVQDVIGPRDWNAISGIVEKLIRFEASKEERIAAWKDAISSEHFCHVVKTDTEIHYNPDPWTLRKVRKIFRIESDSHKFLMAAWSHQSYVLRKLLPEIGILMNT